MIAATRAKRRVNYETDVPRCETCIHWQPARIVMTTNSNTRRANPMCKLHHFTNAANSVCDTWKNTKGETTT